MCSGCEAGNEVRGKVSVESMVGGEFLDSVTDETAVLLWRLVPFVCVDLSTLWLLEVRHRCVKEEGQERETRALGHSSTLSRLCFLILINEAMMDASARWQIFNDSTICHHRQQQFS